MPVDNKKWKKRKWLNPLGRDDNGYIIYGQEADKDPFLKIADCSRIISFNLWIQDEKDKTRVLKKLKILIDSIQELHDGVEETV